MSRAFVPSSRIGQDPHQLIAQSLLCLRESLETIRAETYTRELKAKRTWNCHCSCNPSEQICEVSCVASLNASLARYVDHLSQVFFKKENLRGKTWWTPVFYSLVIQSIVRQLLLQLVDHLSTTSSSIKRFLHLAVRLFAASSGDYDPLVREWNFPKVGMTQKEIKQSESNNDAVRLAVKQKDWKSLGYQNSADYLQKLFEDDGSPIEAQETHSSSAECNLVAAKLDASFQNVWPTYDTRAQRAAQDCDNCRYLKAKCDEERPACGWCKELGVEFHYPPSPPELPELLEIMTPVMTASSSSMP